MSPRTVLFISTLCFLAAFSLAELQSLGKIQSKWKQLLRKRRESGVRNEEDLTPYFDTFLKKPSSLKSHLTERNSRDDVSQLPRTCGKVQAFFEPQSNTIIKTKESMQNGAKFIASPSVHTYDECNKHCCEEPSCSLSVYDGKGMSSCYLFDCSKPDSCQFTEHSNYTSTSITRLPPEAPPGDARENELEDLKQMIPGLVPGRDEDFIQTTKTTTTTTRATTTTTTTAPPTTTTRRTTPRPTRYVTLLERCEFHADCADENAVCDNVCICKAGMKPSYGKCAPVQQSAACSHLQFACQSRPHDSYTHCIASYDKCDGIAQCPLGDDEVGCQGGEFPLDYTNKAKSRPRVTPKKLPQQVPPPRPVTTPPRPKTTPPSEDHEPPKYSSSWASRKDGQESAEAGQQTFTYPETGDRVSGMGDPVRKPGSRLNGEDRSGGRSEDPHRPPEIYDQVDKDIQDLTRGRSWDEEPLSRKRPDVYDTQPYSGVTRQGSGGYSRGDLEPYGSGRRHGYDTVYERPYGSRGRNEGYRDYYDTRPVDSGYGGRSTDLGYPNYRNYPPYQSLGPDDLSSGGRSHIQRRPGVDRLRPPTTHAPPGGEIGNHPGSQMAPLTTPEEEGRKDEPSTEVQSSETHEDTDPATEDSQPASKPDESPSEKPDSTELEKQETHEPDQPASKPSPEPTSKPPSKPTSPPELPKPPSRSKPRVTMGDADHIIVSKIEIERHNADSTFLTYDGDLQGAIVALTLGLTITVVLLVFVVCKLRNVKRRLRRGRLASNDADYLINGMYL